MMRCKGGMEIGKKGSQSEMADYSFVKGPTGNVVGIWVRHQKTAKNPLLLMMLFTKHSNLSGEILEAIMNKRYRAVPNTYDQAGGCFLMFGSDAAPGEPGWA